MHREVILAASSVMDAVTRPSINPLNVYFGRCSPVRPTGSRTPFLSFLIYPTYSSDSSGHGWRGSSLAFARMK